MRHPSILGRLRKGFRPGFAGVLLTCAALLSFFFSSPVTALPDPHGPPPVSSASALKGWIEARNKAGLRVPGYLKAYEFWYSQRAFPNDTIDWKVVREAERQRDRARPAKLRPVRNGARTSPPRWELVGPRQLEIPYQQYYGTGPLAGRINVIAASLSNPGVWWIAVGQGGLWRTQDFGQTWTCFSDGWTNQRIGSVAVDPNDDQVVYAGTGDFNFGNNGYGYGIRRTRDGGATWATVGVAEMAGHNIRRILVCPEDPQVVMAITGRSAAGLDGKVWRSTNGGDTWSAVLSAGGDYSDLEMSDPFPAAAGERYFYVTANGLLGGQVWRSGNRGANWDPLSPPLSRGAGNLLNTQQGLDIAASRERPNTIYLLSTTDQAVFRSDDSGADGTWRRVDATFPNGDSNLGASYNWSQGNYDYHITCAPNTSSDEDVVIVGLIDIVVSYNGGDTWTSAGQTYTANAQTHNDQHYATVVPFDENRILVANDGGLYSMYVEPFNETISWVPHNSNLPVTQFYHAAYSSDATKMLGGTQDNATPVARGNLNAWSNRGGGDGGWSAVNPNDSAFQYTNDQPSALTDVNGNVTSRRFSIYRTTDTWGTQQRVFINAGLDLIAFINPLALDPSNPRFLYTASNFLYRWDTQTGTVTSRIGNTQLANGNATVRCISIAQDGSRIYTGASDGTVAQWNGTAWSGINPALPRVPTSIAVDPTDARDVLVSYSGMNSAGQTFSHVYRCLNADAIPANWIAVGDVAAGLPNAPVNWVTRDPADPDRTWYAASDVGLFMTVNAGVSWENLGTPYGLPNVQVNHVEVVPGTRYLMAATWGRGIWRIQVSDTGGVGDGYEPDGTFILAKGISEGETQTRSLHAPSDQDLAKFSLADDRRALVTAQRTQGVGRLTMDIVRLATLQTVATILEDPTGKAEFRGSLTAGSYGIRISEQGADETVPAYSLSLTTAAGDDFEPDDSQGSATTLPFDGTLQRHTFHVGDFADYFKITVPSTAGLLLEMTEVSADARPRFRLRDPAGDEVFAGEIIIEEDRTAKLVYHCEAPGTYYLIATPQDEVTSGDHRYAIRLTKPALLAPTNFQAVMIENNTKIRVSWTDTNLVDGALDLRRRASGADTAFYSRLNSYGGNGVGDTREFIDTVIERGTTYTYFIRLSNGNGQVESSQISVTVPGNSQPPTAPSDLIAVPLSSSRMLLAWKDRSTDESHFVPEILVGTQWQGRPNVSAVTGSGGYAFTVIEGLQKLKLYSFRIRAQSLRGTSLPSPVGKGTTLNTGQNPFGITAKLTLSAKLNKTVIGKLTFKNPLPVPFQVNVGTLAAPFTPSPTGAVVVPARGTSTYSVQFKPTTRTVPTQAWQIGILQPIPIPITVQVIGKVLR